MSWWNVATVAATAVGSAVKGGGSGGGGGGGGGNVEIDKIDIEETLKGTAAGMLAAAPDILAAEKAIRPGLQQLALQDARTSLMGGSPELREEKAQANAAVKALEAGLSKATAEIDAEITEITQTSFDPEKQREQWNKDKIFLEGEKEKTEDLLSNFLSEKASAESNSRKLNKFKGKYNELFDRSTGKLKKENEVSIDDYNRLGASGRPWKAELKEALTYESNLVEWDSGKKYDWLEKQAESEKQDVTSYLRNLQSKYTRDINTLDLEIGAEGENIETYEPYVRAKLNFDEKKKSDLGRLANQIEDLKKTGQFSDENYQKLKTKFEDASAAVLDGDPGILDLIEYSVNRQADLGERLKEAAANNEFRIMQELAPELVEMYRKTNEPAVTLADIVKQQAEAMIKEPNRSFSDQQKALADLRKTLGVLPDEDSLEFKVANEVSSFIEKESLGSPQLQQDLSDKVGSLMNVRTAGTAEAALLTAAEDRRDTSANIEELSRFGQQQLQEAKVREPSPAEAALGVTAEGLLAAQQRAAGAGETAISGRGMGMLGQVPVGPSTVQQAMEGAATTGLKAPVRGASLTEQALGQAAQEGLIAEERPAGAREQALTQEGLGMLGFDASGTAIPQTPVASPVQQTMAETAIRNMNAEARAASPMEAALGESAMRGMATQMGSASPEEAAMQARIGELINKAGTLSPLERRQVEQEMLALQQRQGRARDTGAAAAVSGRMAEARRADLGQDLTLASGLLGQQDALKQNRFQNELQRLGLGQSAAAEVVGLEATRQDDMLRQQVLGQQAGVYAEQIGLDQAQQGIIQKQTGADFLAEAERVQQSRIQEQLQRQAQATQGAIGAGQLQAGREGELLQRQAQGIQAGSTAEQIELARQQQGLVETQAGAKLITDAEALQQRRINDLLAQQQSGVTMTTMAAQLEAQRQAELQAQQGAGMQALTQAQGLTQQQNQQELAALQAAAQEEAMRYSQQIQGTGLVAGVAAEDFKQAAAARDLERQGLTTTAAVTSDIENRNLQETAMISNLLAQEQNMESQRRAENNARQQQALQAAGQGFGMQTSVTPDVGAYFGRPASQAAGFEAFNQGQQQSMYAADTTAFDYGAGVNLALTEQSNLAGLAAAQSSADATRKAGKYAGIGNVLGNVGSSLVEGYFNNKAGGAGGGNSDWIEAINYET